MAVGARSLPLAKMALLGIVEECQQPFEIEARMRWGRFSPPRRLRLSVGACDYCSETLGSLVSVGATFLTMAKKACGLV